MVAVACKGIMRCSPEGNRRRAISASLAMICFQEMKGEFGGVAVLCASCVRLGVTYGGSSTSSTNEDAWAISCQANVVNELTKRDLVG